MTKEIIQTDQAPEAIGPYSQGVVTQPGRLLFTAGQIALDPKTNSLINGDIEVQTKRVLENIRGVLEAAGSDFDKVVKTTVFLKDINDFPGMNRVYETYFHQTPPARSTVEVSRIPKGGRIEIECVAIIP
ncbi:RidA family protein [bacterium]|nr:RidA family protein [bacterium]